MTCAHCGQDIDPGVQVCPNCGQQVDAVSPIASTTETVETVPALSSSELSPEQKSFVESASWGPTLTWIYLLGNRAWLVAIAAFILALIPLVGLLEFVLLIFVGRRIAWKGGKWSNFDNFQARQKGWDKAGKIITIIFIIAIPLLGVLSALALIAINPSGRISEAEDARTKSDMGQVIAAVEQCHVVTGDYSICDSVPELFDGHYLRSLPISTAKIKFSLAIDGQNLDITAPLLSNQAKQESCSAGQQLYLTFSTESRMTTTTCVAD